MWAYNIFSICESVAWDIICFQSIFLYVYVHSLILIEIPNHKSMHTPLCEQIKIYRKCAREFQSFCETFFNVNRSIQLRIQFENVKNKLLETIKCDIILYLKFYFSWYDYTLEWHVLNNVKFLPENCRSHTFAK